MTQEELNAVGLSHVNLDIPGFNRAVMLRSWYGGWNPRGAFRYNVQTPMPDQSPVNIPNMRFQVLQYFNRPGPNTSTSQFNPTNKYSNILQIIQAALGTRDPNGQTGIY